MPTTRWLHLVRCLAFVLGVYSLLRVLFLFHNHPAFADVTASQIAGAFVYGLRFDLAAVAAINLPFVVLTFLPWHWPPNRGYYWFVKTLFLALNFPFLAINIIDLEFFQFTGRRSNPALLGMAGDVGVKWTALALSYWPLVLLGVLIAVALFLVFGRPQAPKGRKNKPARWCLWVGNLALAIALSVIALRGGLQNKPLSPAQATLLNHSALTQLALNSTFTMLKGYHKSALKKLDYFGGWEELRQHLRPFADGENLLPPQVSRDNIVVLIVESLAAEYCGAGNGGDRYTPFLDSLAGQSLFFAHNYANGRRSIEAMPSILAGLPSLMDQSFTESLYSDHPLIGLGTLLTPHGYNTSFFHGAKKGTMRFDVFMRLAGMQNYFGLEEYPDKTDFDGSWGILDEPYLQYVAKQLSQQRPPFAAVIFTLSSHHPYPVPAKHRDRFKKGTLEIHESIGYADYALEKFFATARQEPWYSNTLFVVTADHPQKLETTQYANTLGHYRVPLLFFHPQKKFPMVDPARITQHVDILPSLLDYLHIQPGQRLLFGRSVFRQGEGRAFLYESGNFWLVRVNRALKFTPGGPSQLFDLSQYPPPKSLVQNESARLRGMEREAQALAQYFNNGLLERQLYDHVK